jgi:ATP-binding cassette subfamily G (WHITE) protein 2
VGYQITLAKFFLFFGLNFLLLLISETLGILCAGLHRNELVGMIILATFYVPLLMFTGFIQVRAARVWPCTEPLGFACGAKACA